MKLTMEKALKSMMSYPEWRFLLDGTAVSDYMPEPMCLSWLHLEAGIEQPRAMFDELAQRGYTLL